MDRNQSDRYGNQSNFHTHRSERYRHPEQDSEYRFDNYGSSARGGYGNEGYANTYGNQGNEMGGSRNTGNRGMDDTYSTSRNYGSMGSYGGAQGFGSSRGGQHPSERYGNDSDTGYNYYSGMGSPDEARQNNLSSPSRGNSYGGSRSFYSDRSGDRGMSSNSGGRNLYGNDTSRRFEGTDQGRYDFDRDNFSSHSYGGGYSGNYMGSGYARESDRDRDSGRGNYDRDRHMYTADDRYAHGSSSTSEPYGMSGYFNRGGGRSQSDYMQSRNQNRTFNREHDRRDRFDRDYDRY